MTKPLVLPLLLFLSLLRSERATGVKVKISSASEFSSFVSNVNRGSTYSGTTVLIDSDLSLSFVTTPIGNSSSKFFLGTFDGQGHIISNLKISSSLESSGLFGYSYGLTIRNVVLDSSCSITSTSSDSTYAYAGNFIGYCCSRNDSCTIENSVSAGDVTFSGTDIYKSYIGGVAGHLYYSQYDINVKNCANYGAVKHSGTTKYSHIGGIAGYSYGTKYVHFQNCLNYGSITHSGTASKSLHLGGIIGRGYYTHIENCVSAGSVSSPNNNTYIGSIVGEIYSNSLINCYYTDDLSKYADKDFTFSVFECSSYDSNTFELTKNVSVGSYTGGSLIDALDAAANYYVTRGYSYWLLNKEKDFVKFTINNRANPIIMDYQIIVLPSLADEGNMNFDGWYDDSKYTSPLKSFSIIGDKELYGKFEENTKNYTITFETRRDGVSVEPKTAHFGAVVSLPSDLKKNSCAIVFWENVYGDYVGLNFTVPAHSTTLYAVWKCANIRTSDDFLDFTKVVNLGKDSFSGTTVYLNSDLSLSGYKVDPIGKNSTNYFSGTFDGQGYVISDLKANSFTYYAGLFGYSTGLTIRNVVLDSSCSIINYNSDYVYIGGLIGECYASSRECNIENSVNMADVTFNGNPSTSNTLFLGGIAGYLYSYHYSVYVKNCANYGSVTHLGTTKSSRIGGITGYFSGSSLMYKYMQNTFNYGTITHNGTSTNSLFIGGIAGYNYHGYIENCVSAGKIDLSNKTSSSRIGSIVGYASSDTYINYCYFTDELSDYEINGTGKPTSTSNTPYFPTTVNSTLISNLNSYASLSNWNKWLLNMNNASVSFRITKKGFTVSSQIILLPDPVDNSERSFSGWYTDEILTSPFTVNEIESGTTLYGIFCGSSYTVILDVNGGDALGEGEDKMIVECNGTYGILPNKLTRTEATFLGWYTERKGGYTISSGDRVTDYNNHTLYAHWDVNQYTLTFIFNNGSDPEVRVIEFNAPIVYPEDPTREGYVFNRWDSDMKFMPAYNLTITAQWTKISKNKSRTPLIVGIVVPVIIILIALVAVILFLYMKKRNTNTNNGEGKHGLKKFLFWKD